jgi:phage terminase large subunit-like protein
VYGWKKPDGTRRYSEVFIYVPKKNGKSAFTAGWILLEMKYGKEEGADFFSAASSRDQTRNVFDHAQGMVKMDDELGCDMTVYGGQAGNIKSIVHADRENVYRCLAADGDRVDGVNPYMNVIDELHRHKNQNLTDILELSTASRAEPLNIFTTTADYDRPSMCNDKLKFARSVCANKGDKSKPGYAPFFLPCVYEIHPEDYKGDPNWWTRRDVWEKVNPSFGATVTAEFFEKEVMKCLETPSRLNNFLRLNLNVCVGQSEHFINMPRYDVCKQPQEHKQGAHCYGGLDLASKHDLTAFALAFKSGDSVDVKVWHWLPKDVADAKEREGDIPYSQWEKDGFIELTPGDYIDDTYISHRIVEICKQYKCEYVNIDPFRAATIVNTLSNEGMRVFDYAQGFKQMNDITETLEKLVLSGDFRHGDNPVLRWQMSNLTVERNSYGHIRPSKKNADSKIDGCVAVLMAMAPWFPRDDELNKNPYINRGLRTI